MVAAIPTSTVSRPREPLFDGIRGVAIILVILSHGWTLWPTETVLANPWLKGLFTSGNFAVSIFFVVGAFLATSALLRQVDSPGGLKPGVAFVRRFIRLSGQLYFLLVVVVLVTKLDDDSSYPNNETGTSVFRIATYTWNWYLRTNALDARPDLGHLWYLSVELQVFALVLVLVYLLARHRGWLLLSLTALVIASLLWRAHAFGAEGAYNSLLQTTTRMDAPLTGAAAAVAVPYLRRYASSYARPLVVLSTLALVPVLYLNDSESGFFGWPGALLDLTLAVFVVCAVLAPAPVTLRRTLGVAPLAYLGRRSLSLYLWHYPVFWFVSRHSADWSWQMRTIVALALALALAELSERLIETRVQRALRSPRWRELDAGIPHFVTTKVRSRWSAASDEPVGGSRRR